MTRDQPAVRLDGGRVILATVAEPTVAGDEVLLAPRFVGVCGTDLHAARLPGHFRSPVTLGHEVVATVVATGDTSCGLAAGDAVVVNPNWCVCGSCPSCLKDRPNLCRTATRERCLGVHEDGALTPLFSVSARACHPLPAGLPLLDAVLVEPLAAAYRAVRRVGSAASCVVLGAGPVGLLVAQLLTAQQRDVVVLDPRADRRELAGRLGIRARPALSEDALSEVVIDCAGTPESFRTAVGAVEPGGLVLLLGVSSEPAVIELESLVLDEITICGSMVYTPQEFAEAIALAADGLVEPSSLVTERIGLADLPARLDEWDARPATGKLVVEFPVR